MTGQLASVTNEDREVVTCHEVIVTTYSICHFAVLWLCLDYRLTVLPYPKVVSSESSVTTT